MDKKSKILLIIVVIVTCMYIGFTFYETVFNGDFDVRFDVPVRE